MSEKIQPIHTEREAYVYVRQSSMQQVRTRLEGQRRQYDLRERAHTLGFQRVTVIDEDLGRSGTGSVERPGFGRLLTAVCTGRVGAVLALEASRLARNNRDWHHLIDLCALTETLLIDCDGIYDPRLLNDRLVLGLTTLLLSPGRIRKCGAFIKPATLFKFHKALVDRKYRLLFSSPARKVPPPHPSRRSGR